MYLAEIAPQNLRGALCTVADLFITFGILLAEAIGFREVLGTEEGKGERKCVQLGQFQVWWWLISEQVYFFFRLANLVKPRWHPGLAPVTVSPVFPRKSSISPDSEEEGRRSQAG